MRGADNLIVEARAALLDAIAALDAHKASVILIGAQAIYLRRATPPSPWPRQPRTPTSPSTREDLLRILFSRRRWPAEASSSTRSVSNRVPGCRQTGFPSI